MSNKSVFEYRLSLTSRLLVKSAFCFSYRKVHGKREVLHNLQLSKQNNSRAPVAMHQIPIWAFVSRANPSATRARNKRRKVDPQSRIDS